MPRRADEQEQSFLVNPSDPDYIKFLSDYALWYGCAITDHPNGFVDVGFPPALNITNITAGISTAISYSIWYNQLDLEGSKADTFSVNSPNGSIAIPTPYLFNQNG